MLIEMYSFYLKRKKNKTVIQIITLFKDLLKPEVC